MNDETRATSKALVAVIDDEPFICDIVRRGLSRKYEVHSYCNSRSMLDALESGRRYALIFCDLLMPEVSGREIYYEIQKRWPEQAKKIIFMSGLTKSEVQEELKLDAIDENQMLKKPFRLGKLRSLARDFIEGE